MPGEAALILALGVVCSRTPVGGGAVGLPSLTLVGSIVGIRLSAPHAGSKRSDDRASLVLRWEHKSYGSVPCGGGRNIAKAVWSTL
jgi:hypothetical protein